MGYLIASGYTRTFFVEWWMFAFKFVFYVLVAVEHVDPRVDLVQGNEISKGYLV